jgi:hypothetical protein
MRLDSLKGGQYLNSTEDPGILGRIIRENAD